MLPPFQRIHVVNSHTPHEPGYVLLANGSLIFTFHAASGKYLTQWRVGDIASKGSQTEQNGPEIEARSLKEEPTVKRRKVATADTTSDASSAEIVIEHGDDTRRPPKKRASNLPSITNLCGSQDGKHVIVATNEDKCIRVLALSVEGKLSTINERFLPKRASSVSLTTNQETVLCADKFGDVYGLPLFPTESKNVELDGSAPSNRSSVQPSTSKPAASALTVHTKRNLEALQHQMAQHAKGVDAKKLRSTEYQPLLGHVSLLTDLLSVKIETEKSTRSYILTSDRDEHIRISRGVPQAHITEGFCLGHQQFVSRLCIPDWTPTMLVSGGGDDFLVSWDWMTGSMRQQISIRPEINRLRKAHGLSQENALAVSGIWSVRTKDDGGQLVVACEGVAALLTFEVDKAGSISPSATLELRSNVLDASVIPGQRAIVYVLDNVREPYSTTNVRVEQDTAQVGMHQWSDSGSCWEEVSGAPVSEIQAWSSQKLLDSTSSANTSGATDVFYYLEHLRKGVGAQGLEPQEP